MNLARFVSLHILLFFLCGCSILNQPSDTIEALKECRFTIKEVKPEVIFSKPEFTDSGFRLPEINILLDTKIEVTNTTKEKIKFNRIHLDLLVDGTKLSHIDTMEKFSVNPGESTILKAKFVVDGKSATESIIKKIEGKKVKYKITGTFYFEIRGSEWPVKVKISEGSS